MVLWSVVVGFVLFLVATCEYYALRTGVPTVTSTPAIRKKMIEILKQEASSRKSGKRFTILDLGSGTGKLTLEIGRALPDAQITGLEVSIAPFLISLLRRKLWGVQNVVYKRENFWPYDLKGVDAVTVYMTGKIRERMAKKLKDDLPPGALVISNETYLPGWEPVAVHKTGLLKLDVVVYRKN